MNVPILVGLALLAVLVALGWPAARALSPTRSAAAATLPATAGLAMSFAVAAAVVTSTSMVPWMVLIVLVGWALLVRRRASGTLAPPDSSPGVWPLVAAAGVALLPVVLVDIPPVESDARYIWWFHANWYRHGGAVTSEGMADPAFAFSRSRYPPLLTGVIAAVWHLVDAYGHETALRVSQLFTAAAIGAVGFHTAAVARLRTRPATVLAATVAAVCWAQTRKSGWSGSPT